MTVLVAVVALALGVLAGSATADQHDHDHDLPRHPHAMLHGFEVLDDGGTPADPSDDVISFDRCVDLANNRALPLTAHHHSLHTGTAGFFLFTFTKAGHVVVPLHPFPGVPFRNCADIEAFFGS